MAPTPQDLDQPVRKRGHIMFKKFNRFTIGVAAIALATMPAFAQQTVKMKSLGTATLSAGAAAPALDTGRLGLEIRNEPADDLAVFKSGFGGVARVPATGVPAPTSNSVASNNFGLFAFNGLTHADQRLAGGGNQFSLEPPDQGLAVGNGFVLEAINTAMAVYDTSGNLLSGPTTLSSFFGLAPEIIRSTATYGPFVSDPKCYYDSATQRFFLTLLEIDQDTSGNYTGTSSVLVAVSQTSSPLGGWNLYSIDTTNAGDPGGPQFGDQPLIGADANGFYITTNEFPLFAPGFNGAQVYATSKSGLESGAPGPVVHFGGLGLAEGYSYSLQPATTPPGGSYESAMGGTEYFLSALDFNATMDNRIAVWALTNTSSLNTATPSLTLTSAVMPSQVYGQPPMTQQNDGFRPLAQFWLNQYYGVPTPPIQKNPLLNTNDDRMNQVVFANGKLWGAVNTVIKPSNGPTSSGIAWFSVTPSVSGAGVAGTVSNQGYVAYSKGNLLFPSIGMNSGGQGVMTFTLSGPKDFPSAAYVPLSASGAGSIHVAMPGVLPDDGFTGYAVFSGYAKHGTAMGVGRWGDYSAACVDEAGNIWFATEYIPGSARTVLANWGTAVGSVTP